MKRHVHVYTSRTHASWGSVFVCELCKFRCPAHMVRTALDMGALTRHDAAQPESGK